MVIASPGIGIGFCRAAFSADDPQALVYSSKFSRDLSLSLCVCVCVCVCVLSCVSGAIEHPPQCDSLRNETFATKYWNPCGIIRYAAMQGKKKINACGIFSARQ